MKNPDDLLHRLFEAASQSRPGAPGPLSPHIESRVLGGWHSLKYEDEMLSLMPVFRRAMIYAGVVMLLSIGWGWIAGSQENGSQTALTSYAMKVQLSP